MSGEIATRPESSVTEKIEQVLIQGDLSSLTPGQRVEYYNAVCRSLALNPLTKPFDFLKLGGKVVLYARKDCTEQLRKLNGVSIIRLEREVIEGVYQVTAYAQDSTGRTDTDMGAVSIEGLKGEALANAIMKACTKSKRRVTLSICGLGMLDETEVEAIPDAQPILHQQITHQKEEKQQPSGVGITMVHQRLKERGKTWREALAIVCGIGMGEDFDEPETAPQAVMVLAPLLTPDQVDKLLRNVKPAEKQA